jgi:hypothetical protein
MVGATAGARADVSLYELPLLGNAGSGKPSDDFGVDSSAGGEIPVQTDAIRRARPACRSVQPPSGARLRPGRLAGRQAPRRVPRATR